MIVQLRPSRHAFCQGGPARLRLALTLDRGRKLCLKASTLVSQPGLSEPRLGDLRFLAIYFARAFGKRPPQSLNLRPRHGEVEPHFFEKRGFPFSVENLRAGGAGQVNLEFRF
jgi:hypothetical protein